MKWCVIGAGGIADRRTIPAMLASRRHELTGLYERVPERATELKQKYGVPTFTDAREMLEKAECDAVYICTPPALHKEHALLCLSYGKHAFIEKPLSVNADDAREIVDAFEKEGKLVGVGYMMKYHNLHQRLKTLVKGGELGKITSVSARFACWYPEIDGAWRQNPSLGGGGVLMDLSVHCLELVEYLLDDEICEVKALSANGAFGYPVEDGGVVVFKTVNGVLGTVAVSFCVPDEVAESKVEVYGTTGVATCYGTLSQEEAGTLVVKDGSATTTYCADGENLYLKDLDKFADLTSCETSYFYARRAVQVQELIDRIYADCK